MIDIGGGPDPEAWQAALAEQDAYGQSLELSAELGPLGAFGATLDGRFDPQSGYGQWGFDLDVPGLPVGGGCTMVGSTSEGFIEVPEPRRAEFGGRRWLRVPLDDLPIPTESLGTAVPDFEVFGELEEVGEEDIRGVTTTRYNGAIDQADLDLGTDELLGGLDLGDAGALVEGLEVPTSIPVGIWVGDDDLVRRIRMEIAVGNLGSLGLGDGAAQDLTVAATFEFFDFEQVSSVTPPNPADVAEGDLGSFEVCFVG